MVRAKFECYSIETRSDSDGKTIRLRAVYDSNPESDNGKFFKYTPAGEITMQCVNPAASDQFEAGKEYYIDFTVVEGE